MRKLISIFLCLCLIACIVPAVAEYTLHAIDSTEFPLYGAVASVEEMGTLKLYFLNGVNDLPYIELHDWLALAIKCFREDDTTEEGAYNLTLETAGPSACFTRETQYSLVIDFNANTFRFPDYNLFMKNPTMSTPLDFTSRKCYNKDGEPSLMKKNEEFTFDRYGSEMVINFGDYGIDLIQGFYTGRPSEVPVRTIHESVRQEILAENLSLTRFDRETKVYNASDGETLDLLNLAMDHYTCIRVSGGHVTLTGQKTQSVDMLILIAARRRKSSSHLKMPGMR